MPLVFAGVCTHGPGTTGRAERADPAVREPFFTAYRQMAADIKAAGAEVLLIVAAEHFANFFMNNMPAFAMGMADWYEGPVEDPEFIKIPHRRAPGDKALSRQLIESVQQSVDVAYAEEWRLDHGVIVPLHFLSPENDLKLIPCNINCQGPPLTPLSRAFAFGEALREACDAAEERIAIVGTGGISHWPATPDSGKINETFDREFMRRWAAADKDGLLSYTDAQVYAEAGQGGFEIRTYIAAAAAAGGEGELQFYTAELPIFAVGVTVVRFDVAEAA